MLNPGEYQVTAKASGYSSVSRKCVVGFEPGATLCNFELSKSNWDRIKEIMALHGNRPIRLLSPGKGNQYTASHGNRRISNQIPNGNDRNINRIRRLRRLRRLRQQRLLARMSTTPSTTTTLPPTTTQPTTTPSPTTTYMFPPSTENITAWYYDSWLPEEENTTQPELEITDSLDYDYNYKIDDY